MEKDYNVFSDGELSKENNTQKMRVDGVKQKVPFYTLDVIISVGYRVKSKCMLESYQTNKNCIRDWRGNYRGVIMV